MVCNNFDLGSENCIKKDHMDLARNRRDFQVVFFLLLPVAADRLCRTHVAENLTLQKKQLPYHRKWQ